MWREDKHYGRVAQGEDHGRAKLTVEKVRLIRNSCATSEALALMFRVARATINDVRAYRTWRHVL